jgi:hypothetical protein
MEGYQEALNLIIEIDSTPPNYTYTNGGYISKQLRLKGNTKSLF